MFFNPRRFASRRAPSTISAIASVHVTDPFGPTLSAIVIDGSPAPPATSSTDCPSRMPARSIIASVSGANIPEIVSLYLVQYCALLRQQSNISTGFSELIVSPVNPVKALYCGSENRDFLGDGPGALSEDRCDLGARLDGII